MLFKRLYLYILTVLLSIAFTYAQVQVSVKIDSFQVFIGEQTDVTLNITMGAKQNLQLPAFKKGDEIIPNIEIVDIYKPDSTFLDEGKRVEIQQRYTITAWDSAFYYLPPYEVKVDGKSYMSESKALKVYTIDVDTLHLDRFYPPYPVMSPEFAWSDWNGGVYASFLVVLLLLAIYVLLDRVIKGKPIVRIIRRKKKLPPHKVAINEIERIKADRKWAEEDSKEYYTLLTDALRNYIQERYGFSAMEMTSTEIIERLIEDKNEEALNELKEIFRTADLVKFAKYSTLINENDANLVAALEYINQTKVEVDPNAKQEPEIIKETDTKRMNQVKIMRGIMVVLALLSLALIGWIAWRTYNNLM